MKKTVKGKDIKKIYSIARGSCSKYIELIDKNDNTYRMKTDEIINLIKDKKLKITNPPNKRFTHPYLTNDEKAEKAKCGICFGLLQWDWCQDTYYIDGKPCKIKKLPSIKGWAFICTCGQVLGFMIEDGDVYLNEEFRNFDWEDPINSWG